MRTIMFRVHAMRPDALHIQPMLALRLPLLEAQLLEIPGIAY
jgi:hypothetical protein